MKKASLKFTAGKKQGYNCIVSPKNSRLTMIEFGRVNLRRGESLALPVSKKEVVLTLLRGRCSVECDGLRLTIGPRKNVFDEHAWAVYVRGITQMTLSAGSRVDALVTSASASSRSAVVESIEPSDVAVRTVGSATYRRRVRTIVGEDFPARRLLVGETINEAGKWSSYPPHRHEKDAFPHETKLEEVYFYMLEEPKSFGMQRIYTDDGRIDETHTVRDGDLCVLPRGYHPVSAAPNSRLYYFWALAGRTRKMCVRVDPSFE